MHVKFPENGLHMMMDGVETSAEAIRNHVLITAGNHQIKHLSLDGSQVCQRQF